MVMFLEILKTLLQVLCVFSILLIAFGMAFFMLMNKEVNNVLCLVRYQADFPRLSIFVLSFYVHVCEQKVCLNL